jgi:hypothetical protein
VDDVDPLRPQPARQADDPAGEVAGARAVERKGLEALRLRALLQVAPTPQATDEQPQVRTVQVTGEVVEVRVVEVVADEVKDVHVRPTAGR